ncbi:MAG: hypothetical protein ACJAVF_002274, partial [Paraglaciecola sp.]
MKKFVGLFLLFTLAMMPQLSFAALAPTVAKT